MNVTNVRRATVVAAATTALALTLVGCSPSSSGSGGSSSGQKGKEITVAIVPKLLGAKIFEATVSGAKSVAKQLHEKIVYTASVNADGADQAQVIQGLVNSNNRPDVIVVSANDPTSEVQAMQAAQRAGIKVITWDSDVTPSARSYFIQDTAYADMGQALVDGVVKKIGTSGQYAIMSSTPDAAVQNAWLNAIKSYAKSKYPGLDFVGVGFGQGNVATSQTVAANLLNSHPDLKAILPIDSNAMPGTLAAVKSQGLVGKVAVLGVADIDPNTQYFKDGSLTALYLWDVVKQGELIAYVARGMADGTITGPTPTFKAGPLGKFTVLTKPAPGTIIFSKPLAVDKDNYTKYDF